ncbi:MAG: NAD(+)/NADH kinase [Bacteroidales bacterium]|nr:NAD(+)/NADH kinase [Bacteroidales bacterium]
MLNKVAIFSKENNVRTSEGVATLVKEFSSRGIQILIHQRSAGGSFWSGSGLPDLPDIVISVGGDGTFLETMLKVKDLGIPVAGVNTGRMGFLANISNEEISHSVDMLCKGDFELIDRSLLEISEPDGLFGGSGSTALNEITIQKNTPSMVTINVYVDDIYLNTYWADGLIVSTATGSTAYNLSVGGPILSPGDESIVISPISPHNLTIRPIILSGVSRLRLKIEGRSDSYLATCDFRSEKLDFGREVNIVRSPKKLRTVMLKGMDFYSTLRNKLMWGADKRN